MTQKTSWAERYFNEREFDVGSPEALCEALESGTEGLRELMLDSLVPRSSRFPNSLPGQGDDIFDLFFRGQINSSWGISSSLQRFSGARHEAELAEAERRVIDEMRDHGLGLNATDGQLLMMLQHHSIPTRLIDVSTSPQPALFFAAEKEDQRDGRLFVIGLPHYEGRDAPYFDAVQLSSEDLPWDGAAKGKQRSSSDWTKRIALVEEVPIDPRMMAQEGRFLVGGLIKRYAGENPMTVDKGEEVPIECWPEVTSLNLFFPKKTAKPAVRPPALGWSIRIKATWKPKLREWLQNREDSISEESIYPKFIECERIGKGAAEGRVDPRQKAQDDLAA